MQPVLDLCRKILALPDGASTVSDDIDALHVFVISVTMLVSTFVFATTAWFSVRYRRVRERQLTVRLVATRRHEATLIAGILGIFLLWWFLGFRQYVRLFEPPKDADVVYVTAKQWMWKFTYADGVETNDVLTVPVGRPIRVVMTSRDVIHSFYVPAFRIKMDVVPGRTTTTWFSARTSGTYPIFCAEYCGVSHSYMAGSVVSLSEEDYARWKREATRDEPPALADVGRRVAVRRACVACHTLDGQPHVGPTWSRLYGAPRVLSDGRRIVADDAYLTRSMMEPGADVVLGFKNVMPAYQGTLDPGETAALVELIKSLRDGPAAFSGVELPALTFTPKEFTASSDAGASPAGGTNP